MNQIMDNSFLFLVDADNMFFGAMNLYTEVEDRLSSRIDFIQLKERAFDKRSFAMTYAKVFSSSQLDNFQSYANMLSRSGYSCVIVPKRINNRHKASLDITLAIDAVTFKFQDRLPSNVCIASGDSNFIPVIKHFNSLGVVTEVMSFEQCLSKELAQTARKVSLLDKSVMFREEDHVA